MTPELESYLQPLQSKTLLLDSNLLTLHITATYDPLLISRFKRTQSFDQNDAILLAWLMGWAAGIATTSHILTETSNLGNSLSYIARDGWFDTLAEFIDETHEHLLPARNITILDGFSHFGLTDTALRSLPETCAVVTTDGRLAAYMSQQQSEVLDFQTLKLLI